MSDKPKSPEPPKPLNPGASVPLQADAKDRASGSGPATPSPRKPKKKGSLLTKLAVGFGGFLVLVVAILLVAPSFVDWNSYKSEIEAQAKTAAGLDLKLAGDVSLSLLPTPSLAVESVSIANAPGAASEHIVSLDALEVRIALGPLLGGTLQVETIRLVSPRVEIETMTDGTTNIDALLSQVTAAQAQGEQALPPRPGEQATAETDAAEAGLVPGVKLDNFTIENGLIVYRDQVAKTEEHISAINADIIAESLEGPFKINGSLIARDVPIELDLLVRRLIQGRTAPFAATLRLAQGETELNVNGAVTELDVAPKFKGKVEAEGKNLGRTVQSLLGPAAPTLPGLTGQSFSLVVDSLFAGTESVTAQDIAIALGSTKATGGVTLDMGENIDFTAELAVGQVDLDAWLAMPDLPGGAAASGVIEIAEVDGSIAIPVRNPSIILAATGVSGEASPLIPANLAGSVAAQIGAITYNGQAIQQIQLSAEVGNSEVTLSQASARLPGSTDVAAFGFLGGTTDAPSFEGEVEATANDLRGVLAWLKIPDQDLPSDRLRRLSFRSQLSGTPEQVSIAGIDLQVDASRLTGGVTLAVRERLAFGANLNLDSIDLDAYLPKPASKPTATEAVPATGDATASDGAAQTAPAVAGNPLDALKPLADFDMNLRASLGKLVYQGATIRDVSADIGLFNGALDIKSFSVKNAEGAALKVRGGLNDLAAGPKMKDLTVDLGISNLQRLAKVAALNLPEQAQGLKRVDLSLRGNGPVFKPTLASTLRTAGLDLRVSGKASVLPLPNFNGSVAIKHGDLQRLLRTLRIDFDPQGPIGATDIQAKVKASPTDITVSGLKGQIGQATFSGETSVKLVGARPAITAALALGDFVVDPFLPKPAEAPAPRAGRSGASGGGAGATGSPLKPAGGQWPTEPLDLSGLKAVDANVAVTAKSLTYEAYAFRNVDLALTLQDGRLQTQRLKGQLFGGNLDGSLGLNAEPVSTSVKLGLDGLRIGQALQAVTGTGVASGTFGMTMDLQGSGSNVAQLVSNLNGQGAISANRLDVQGVAQGSVLAPFIGLVGGINQIASIAGGRQGKGLADVTGSFNITNGVATTNDTKVDSSLATGVATGSINLPAWTVDLSGNLNLAQNALAGLIARAANVSTSTKIPFSVKGVLDAPDVKVDTAAFGGSGGLPIPGADRLIDSDSKAGKVLNKILPGLLGGGSGSSQGTTQQQVPSQYGEPGAPPPPSGGTQTPPPAEQKRPVRPEDLIRGVLGF